MKLGNLRGEIQFGQLLPIKGRAFTVILRSNLSRNARGKGCSGGGEQGFCLRGKIYLGGCWFWGEKQWPSPLFYSG